MIPSLLTQVTQARLRNVTKTLKQMQSIYDDFDIYIKYLQKKSLTQFLSAYPLRP